MAKALKYTEQQLAEMLIKNPNLKINSSFGRIEISKSNDSVKISLDKKENTLTKVVDNKTIVEKKVSKIVVSEPIKKKNKTNIHDITKINKSSLIKTSVSEDHLSIVFESAKLLTVNQIFAFLQNKKLKFSYFSYKKSWHDIIKNILNELQLEQQKINKNLPFFDTYVELTLFRQAPKLVDEDALATMFKFIIDALKKTTDNPNGILAEDNPKIVHKIFLYSEKGPHCVGIKVKLIKNNQKEAYNTRKLLEI